MKKRNVFGIAVLIVALVGALAVYFCLPVYFYNNGVKAFNAKKYKDAYSYLIKARLWNKNNSNYNYYYAQTLAKFRPTYNIQKEMCEIAASPNKDSAQKFAEIAIATWKSNVIATYGGNYIDQAPTNGEIIRWNPKTFPLKVYVDYNSTTKYPEYYNWTITRAFNKWHESVDFISFNFVTNQDNADIIIDLKGTPDTGCEESGCKYVLAHTEPVIKRKLLKKMIITVYDKDATGAFFSDRELYNTVLHEIGHALGIMGHSYSTDDLMYLENKVSSNPRTVFIQSHSTTQLISKKDISTLKLLYNIVPTITNTPISEINTKNLLYPEVVLGNMKYRSSQKLREARNYIREAPDIPNGYIDLAVAYDELGQFKKAESAFQEALARAKTQDDQYLIYYNFATLYLNHDMPTEALQYARQAQNIKQSEDILDLIGNIEHALNTNSKPFWQDWSKK